eukprot:4004267-Amphidinium_carterae.1
MAGETRQHIPLLHGLLRRSSRCSTTLRAQLVGSMGMVAQHPVVGEQEGSSLSSHSTLGAAETARLAARGEEFFIVAPTSVLWVDFLRGKFVDSAQRQVGRLTKEQIEKIKSEVARAR